MNIGKLADLGDLYAEVNPEGTAISIKTTTVMYKNVPIGDLPRKEVYMNCDGKDYMVVLEFVGGEGGHVEARVHELLEQNGRVGINQVAYKILPMGAPTPDALTNQTMKAAPPVVPEAPGLNVHTLMDNVGAAPPVVVAKPMTTDLNPDKQYVVQEIAPPAPMPAGLAHPVPMGEAPVQLEMLTPEPMPITPPVAPGGLPPIPKPYSVGVSTFAKRLTLEQAQVLVTTSTDKGFFSEVCAYISQNPPVDPAKVAGMLAILVDMPDDLVMFYDIKASAKHIVRELSK